ncbi:MAG: cytochrome d ubiquinol oxidase subunit II [Acidobacteria bacterium]|nr:cytochrome d ubiquinol oxidase subunit II [Acidobacteriota bacterium]
MEILWFCLVAIMIAGYVILDGFDLGAGIVHFSVGRTELQRRQVLKSIGPVWDGNEVWLLAAGGTLYFAFPGLYASSFSGFYLPLMIVLWLLILRGIAIEFRNHVEDETWKPFWDAVFTGASGLLAIFFGAALGNVVRGVPLDSSGYFFLPLWTDFRTGAQVGILDWYTILVGVLAFVTLTVHGALWIALKTEAVLNQRARRVAIFGWVGVAGLTLIVTGATLRIQPQVSANLAAHPFGYVFPALALAGLLGILRFLTRGDDLKAFLSSCAYIAGMLTSAAFGVFPYVLPSNTDPKLGLTIYNTATGQYGLVVGLMWWIPGMILALGYFVFAYRRFAGKVQLETEGY